MPTIVDYTESNQAPETRVHIFDEAPISLIFNRGNEIAKVHKSILIRKSGFFCDQFVSDPQGNLGPEITLTGDWPWAVKIMLEFMYKDSYTRLCEHDLSIRLPNVSKLDLHVHAYAIGQKYQVIGLPEKARELFMAEADRIVWQEDLDPDLGRKQMLETFNNDPETALTAGYQPGFRDRALPRTGIYPPVNLHTPEADMIRFLHALQLLFLKVSDRQDGLRKRVLQLMMSRFEFLAELNPFKVLLDNDKEIQGALKEVFREEGYDLEILGARDVLKWRGRLAEH